MEIRPLSAKETANGSGNRTKVGRAQTVYICATVRRFKLLITLLVLLFKCMKTKR